MGDDEEEEEEDEHGEEDEEEEESNGRVDFGYIGEGAHVFCPLRIMEKFHCVLKLFEEEEQDRDELEGIFPLPPISDGAKGHGSRLLKVALERAELQCTPWRVQCSVSGSTCSSQALAPGVRVQPGLHLESISGK